MPASNPLMPNLVCRIPVVAPASMPAAKPSAVAGSGPQPLTRKTAVTTAPKVKEPAVVMSANEKMRKLRNTPRDSRARIRPIVQAPSSGTTSASFLVDSFDRPKPTGAADEFTLANAADAAIVAQQVEHTLQPAVLE